MSTSIQEKETSMASLLAPEDIEVGHYVTISDEVEEFVLERQTQEVCCSSTLPDMKIVRKQLWSYRSGYPLKVVSICLPFILVKLPQRDNKPIQLTLDIRQLRLMRLDTQFAKAAFEGIRGKRKKDKKAKNKKNKRRGK